MLVALDTNVLVYAEGINGKARQGEALALVGKLAGESTLIPVQVLGELFNVLTGKAGQSPDAARTAVLRWGDAFPLIETSSSVLLLAMDLCVDHHVAMWDAIILSAAADASCRLLISEDLQEGFTWSGVTVANPFAKARHPLLDALLAHP
jgi:predicted nucleic acid-binding protein